MPVVHDSSAAVVHLLAALDRMLATTGQGRTQSADPNEILGELVDQWKAGRFGNLITGLLDPAEARRFHAQLLRDNAELINRNPGLILSSSANEFTEPLTRGGLLHSDSLFGTVLPPGVRRTLDSFQGAFEVAMDSAGIHMTKGLEVIANGDPTKVRAINDYVNSMRGLSSSAALGVSPNQRELEAALLLAPRYRRATAALHVDAVQGGVRGQIARRALLHLAAGLAFTYTGIRIVKGVKEGKSFDQIKQDVQDGMDPRSSRFMLWRIGGQVLGPGSKFVSDARLLTKVFTRPEDFIAAGEENAFFRWIRAQSSGVVSTSYDLFTGRDYLGEPTRGLLDELQTHKNIGKRILQNVIPFWGQTVAFEGGTPQDRLIRGASEFTGFTFPEGVGDIQRRESRNVMEKEFDDLESFEKDLLRSILQREIDPLQEQDAERGRDFSVYFERLDEIESQRREALLAVVQKNGDSFATRQDYRRINNVARGRREQAGLDREFESDDPTDPITQYFAVLDDPQVQLGGGEIDWDRVEFLRASIPMSQEERAELIRNTNRRPLPIAVWRKLPKKQQAQIRQSQQMREQALVAQGRLDLAEQLARWFWMLDAQLAPTEEQ